MKRRTVLTGTAALLTGCVGGSTSPQVDSDAPPDERLRQRVLAVLNPETIVQSPSVDVEREGGGYFVSVGYQANTNIGADGTKNLTDNVAYKAAEAVFRDDEATVTGFGIIGMITVENQYGETSQAELTRITISDETAERIVWENTTYADLQQISDTYEFHSEYF